MAQAKNPTAVFTPAPRRRHVTDLEPGASLTTVVAAAGREACASYGRTHERLELDQGSATYLFDHSATRSSRTILAIGRPQPHGPRDAAYQRGYPLPERVAGRALDRGHYIAHGIGGAFGPNMFVQDRALNRGWSPEGARFRRLERLAADHPGSVTLVRPRYVDDTDFPAFLDLAIIADNHVWSDSFRNRYDQIALPHRASAAERLAIALAGADRSRVGDLGEETAAIFLEEELGAVIVAMGDCGMPRRDNRQDLDILAVLDGELCAIEVKSRLIGRHAGRRTRAGNLPAPRMRRPTGQALARQGSQAYLAPRLEGFIDTNQDYDGITSIAIVVDLTVMQIQAFTLSDDGRRTRPLTTPTACRDHALEALDRIVTHRGHL